MKFIDWEPCLRCDSKKVKSTGIGKGKVFLMGLITLSCSMWLLIIPPIGLLGMAIGFIIMMASPFIKKKNTFICLDCNNTWENTINSEPQKGYFNYDGTI